MEYPDYFPNDCPPEDAEYATGEVIRIIKGASPTEQDFIPNLVLIPNRDYSGKECMASGLSVYRKIEDVFRMINRVPAMKKKLGKLRFAKGTLTPELGVMKHTPHPYEEGSTDTHHTWWVPTSIKPWLLFTIMDISGE